MTSWSKSWNGWTDRPHAFYISRGVRGVPMRLFTVGDLHQNAELKDAVVAEVNDGGYDLFIGIGDYEDPGFYNAFIEELELPSLSVTGNWDFSFTPPENGEYFHLFNYKKVEFNDYRIVLLGAVYPDDFQQQVKAFFDGVPNSHRIVASHYPPHMLGDLARTGTRAGFPEFRELIMREKPALWCCGHIHEDFGSFSLLKTTVLNCAAAETGKGWAVELGADGVEEADEVQFLTAP